MRKDCGPEWRSSRPLLPCEFRLPVAHLPRRVGHVADRTERGSVHHHGAGETQAARFADRPGPRILDPFKIDIVREAEDTADDLGCRKSYRVLTQPDHIRLP